MQVHPKASSVPFDPTPQSVAYDFSNVPPADLVRVQLVVKAFENWHDPKVVSDDDVIAARKALAEIRVTPGAGMLFFRLDEIPKFHAYAGGPGVIAPDGTVRGQILGGGRPMEVTFNILASRIVLNHYRDAQQKPLSTIEKLQALAKEKPEFGAGLSSPEALVATVKRAASENDMIGLSFLFVPGSLGKLVGKDLDNATVLTMVGVESLLNIQLGELLWERDQDGVTVRSYAIDKGTQEFERHGAIWLMLP